MGQIALHPLRTARPWAIVCGRLKNMTYLNEIAIAVNKSADFPDRFAEFLEAPAPEGCRADKYEHDRYWLWHCSAIEWPTDELPGEYNGSVRVSSPNDGIVKELLDFLHGMPVRQFAFVRVGEHWGDLEVEGDPADFGILPTQSMELPMGPHRRVVPTI